MLEHRRRRKMGENYSLTASWRTVMHLSFRTSVECRKARARKELYHFAQHVYYVFLLSLCHVSRFVSHGMAKAAHLLDAGSLRCGTRYLS